MRPDAMSLEVVLSCPTFGSTEQPNPDGTTTSIPRTVRINGKFGDLDPLTTEDAAVVLPKLAYIFEALVKEHNARKEAQLQRLAMQQQAAAQQARQAELQREASILKEQPGEILDVEATEVEATDQASTEATATDQEATDAG